uniref:Coatomer subunit beta n=2 Tax=Toxoplasma gondii TaxID=5811 RepID=COPB_TOXGO|nr:RecName: Full=Coatomer subunit beta; AltName: Full=Beta-coat protein; Short=Beta-COP [Toxoplasma gondii]AAF02542.2 beta coatomer [Toxoplasma gondii]
MELERNCMLYIYSSRGDAPSTAELQKKIESPNEATKAEGMQDLIIGMTQGEAYTRLLMTVIRYAMPSKDKRVKKLTQLYLEIVGKCRPDGSLKEEMILICNALRNDLMSPNEYVRGSTLRLLSKIRQFKVLEPLVEAILQNLTHRHSYVRRNAVMCVYSIVKNFGLDAIPATIDQIEQMLLSEGDLTTKRNAFLVLVHCASKRAIQFILQQRSEDGTGGLGFLLSSGDLFQLALLELLRKVCRQKQQQKAGLLRLIVSILPNTLPSVAYEGACSLLALSRAPVSLKAAAGAFASLLCGNSDNNVKLIVLDRLQECVQRASRRTMEEFVIDLLRGLQTPSLEVRRKILDLVLQIVGKNSVEQLLNVLKRELLRTAEPEQLTVPRTMEYRRLLIKAVHSCCTRFPEAAASVVNVLIDFPGDPDVTTATEVAVVVRELVATCVHLRSRIISRVVDAFPDSAHARVLRVSLWMLGEFCEDSELLDSFLTAVYAACSPLPFTSGDSGGAEGEQRSGCQPKLKMTTRTVVLEDGTYGTEDVYESVNEKGDSSAKAGKTALRKFILGGDFLLASTVAVTCAKLILKTSDEVHAQLAEEFERHREAVQEKAGRRTLTGDAQARETLLERQELEGKVAPVKLRASTEQKTRVLYLVACLLKFLRLSSSGAGAHSDAAIRVCQSLRALCGLMTGLEKEKAFVRHWVHHGRFALERVLALGPVSDDPFTWNLKDAEDEKTVSAPDDLAFFRQLRPDRQSLMVASEGVAAVGEDSLEEDEIYYSACAGLARGAELEEVDETEADLQLTVGGAGGTSPSLSGGNAKDDAALFQQRLAKVQPITGQADPLYVEAFLQVNQFDLLVEMLVVNRTQDSLQNVTVEPSTHGDLKLVERPAPVSLAPGQQAVLHAPIKVRSTEAGIILGYVTFSRRGSSDKECLVLNELHIDVLDYIERRWTCELAFRSMWAEFEWENKIHVNTSFTDVSEFLEHLMKMTNLTVVGFRPPASVMRRLKFSAACAGLDEAERAAGDGEEDEDRYLQSVRKIPTLRKLSESSSFFAVNLYSRSIFGEDALVNVSIEKLPGGKLAGSIRIRSRTQGIALSLGDRITVVQRGLTK